MFANKIEHLSLRLDMIPDFAPEMVLFIMNKMKDKSIGIKSDRRMFNVIPDEQSSSGMVSSLQCLNRFCIIP